MKSFVPAFCLATAVAVSAKTAPKASTAPAHAPAKASTAAGTKTGTTAAAATYKLPPDEKRIPGIPKTVASLKYQDIKIGTGPEGESGKLWHVKYKGWRAADGVVFDNWEDHKRPVTDAEGKPVNGPDGKPQMGDPEPLVFPQGMGRLIPGFDYGVMGMHVGGKRRLFIPWQMAYGNRSVPDRPDHPGIPAKSDLIFDVELVEVGDMPAPTPRPMVPPAGAPGSDAHPATPPTGSAPATSQPASPDTTKPSTPPPADTKPAQPTTPPPSN
jgi:peptidylprolyl isomerase